MSNAHDGAPKLASRKANREIVRTWTRPLLALGIAVVIVYARLFSAGFVGFDDDIHVYANPFLNPPTLQSVARLWQHAYERLYIPLAYTLYAAIASFARVPARTDSSIGHVVSLDPAVFHAVSIGFHVMNTWLCFLLVQRLTRRRATALFCTLLFALHPLQLESVGWISELRGLSGACFALLALNALVFSRQVSSESSWSRRLPMVSGLLLVCAMLCKPTAVVLPLVALAIERIVLGTAWRKAVVTASFGTALALPFLFVTHSLQGVSSAGASFWWQRPFIAADALVFYLQKTLLPIQLCVDYGRTPRVVMSHAWAYVAWVIPLGLLLLAYRSRKQRPLTWLGALTFVIFLLPTLGLVPFSFQAYSTVADRYAYLALIGVGLVFADVVESVKARTVAERGGALVIGVLAILSFNQSRNWLDSGDFLRHTLDVNPDAAFAYSNLGDAELANGDLPAALSYYQSAVQHDPTLVHALINLADIYATSNQPAEAESALAKAQQMPKMTADEYSNLGIVLMKLQQAERALRALATAVAMEPESPTFLFNQASALSATGKFERAEATFRRCIALAPTLAGAHTGLGIVLAETRRLAEALNEFRTAAELQPNDPAALDNLKRAEAMMAGQKL